MPQNPKKILEDKITLEKAKIARLDLARRESLKKARSLLLKAQREGMSQSHLARIWKTNPTRMKEMLMQAEQEEIQ